MSAGNDIDDLFRKELESRAPEFKEEYWTEAERVLDANQRWTMRKRSMKWTGAVLFVAMLAGVTGYFFGTQRYSDNAIKNVPPVSSTGDHNLSSANEQTLSRNSTAATDQFNTDTLSVLENPATESAGAAGIASSSITDEQKSTGNHLAKATGTGETISSSRPLASHTANNTIDAGNPAVQAQSNFQTSSTGTVTKVTTSAVSDILPEQKQDQPQNATSGAATATTMNELMLMHLPDTKLSFDRASPSMIHFTSRSHNLWKKNKSSGLHYFELSATGAGTLITVPSNNSSQWGYEWNALLQYRFNQWIAGTGIGQFFVKDQIHFTTDSMVENTVTFPVVNLDTLMVIDSFLVDSNFFPHYEYDTTFVEISDTTYQSVTTIDTIQAKGSAASSGRYIELPVMFGYRFYAWGLRWQITAGGSYGWYSGGLRYALNEEGILISYKPPPVISVMTRLYIQYPLTRRLYLQGYAGARYVIGLKSDVPSKNYLIYSVGAGLLYQF